MKKILLVEDNESIVKGLKYLLEKKYLFHYALTVEEAEAALENIFDLIILDVTLSDVSKGKASMVVPTGEAKNGFQIAEKLQRLGSKTPILFLTARDLEEDIVKGLSLGEDYIIKPFRNSELLIRIEKILKRTDSDMIYFGDISLDNANFKAYDLGRDCDLTILEFNIAKMLFTNTGKVVSRDRILSAIWDENNKFVNDNTLTVYIKRIREKLGNKYIKTVKGVGYKVSRDE